MGRDVVVWIHCTKHPEVQKLGLVAAKMRSMAKKNQTQKTIKKYPVQFDGC